MIREKYPKVVVWPTIKIVEQAEQKRIPPIVDSILIKIDLESRGTDEKKKIINNNNERREKNRGKIEAKNQMMTIISTSSLLATVKAFWIHMNVNIWEQRRGATANIKSCWISTRMWVNLSLSLPNKYEMNEICWSVCDYVCAMRSCVVDAIGFTLCRMSKLSTSFCTLF